MTIVMLHLFLALLLFFLVNWIGEHAVDFGYVSTTLFEEPNESIALNFFLRALSPAVFLIAVSAVAVAMGHAELRVGIFKVAYYYYAIRAIVICAFNRHHLISWPRFTGHALIGIAAATLAYRYLILPNRSLLPDLNGAGNELWLAIFAFLYAVANKIPLSGGPGARRRNAFVARHYNDARRRFGDLIDRSTHDDLLRLTIYAVLIYEDYCRPPTIRHVERLMWWKQNRTTGIMQVASKTSLSDRESVTRGATRLATSWSGGAVDEGNWVRVRRTIADYNRDDDYIGRVMEVMEILAKRAAPEFEPAYDRLYD